jgi:MFS family permease
VFKNSYSADIALSDWISRTPPAVAAQHVNVSEATSHNSPRTSRKSCWNDHILLKKVADPVDIKPFVGLCGVLIAAMTSEFNDQVTSIALTDVRGALGIGHDSGTWIESLYVSAEIIGMAMSPWLLVTFTLRRWTLFAIALCGASSVLIPFSPNVEAIYALRLLQHSFSVILLPLRVVLLSNTTDPIPAGTFAPVRIRSAADLLNTLTSGPTGTHSTMDRVKGIGRLWSSAWIPKPSTAALSKPARATAESNSSAAILPTAACRGTVSVPETTSIFSSTILRAASGVTGHPLVQYPFSVVGELKIAGTLILTIPAVADPNLV